ncbi:MAG: ferredoxin, partial [Sphingomonas sp.]
MTRPACAHSRWRVRRRKGIRPRSSAMTYVVTDACIRCKYMDCVEV